MITRSQGIKLPRDSQRSRVYKAEREAFKGHVNLDYILPSLESCEKYARHVAQLKRISRIEYAPAHYSHKLKAGWTPTISDGRGSPRARALGSVIQLPHWARKKWVILHELTHLLVPWHIRPSHGWEFCATYLKVVLYAEGREAHDLLKASFKKHKIRFRPKRTITMTPERKAELSARMAAMRAARKAAA